MSFLILVRCLGCFGPFEIIYCKTNNAEVPNSNACENLPEVTVYRSPYAKFCTVVCNYPTLVINPRSLSNKTGKRCGRFLSRWVVVTQLLGVYRESNNVTSARLGAYRPPACCMWATSTTQSLFVSRFWS